MEESKKVLETPSLEEISNRLYNLIIELEEAGEEYSQIDFQCKQRKAQLYMSDGILAYRNAETRDAQVNLILENEGMAGPLITARGRFKKLEVEKDILIEISKNLREVSRSKGEE